MVTNTEIDAAFAKMAECQRNYYFASQQAFDLKNTLEVVKAKYLLSGEIAGKNETEREAKARELLPQMYDQSESANHDERLAKMELICAQLEIDRLNMLLKVDDITTRNLQE